MISEERYAKFKQKVKMIEEEKKRLYKTIVKPSDEVQQKLEEIGSSPLKEAIRAYDLLKRPEMTYAQCRKNHRFFRFAA